MKRTVEQLARAKWHRSLYISETGLSGCPMSRWEKRLQSADQANVNPRPPPTMTDNGFQRALSKSEDGTDAGTGELAP